MPLATELQKYFLTSQNCRHLLPRVHLGTAPDQAGFQETEMRPRTGQGYQSIGHILKWSFKPRAEPNEQPIAFAKLQVPAGK